MFSDKFICRNNDVCDFDNHVPAPLFRKVFSFESMPEKAELTICGLGFYELFVNGNRITKGALAPYINNPDDILYYDVYDIKKYLAEGENVIGIMLGNGFFNPFGGYIWDFDKAPWRGGLRVAFSLETEINGETSVFEADETVKTSPSPIWLDDLRIGAFYDARKEQKGWSESGFDDSDWENAIFTNAPLGEKRLCKAEPVVVYKELTPLSITHFDELYYNTYAQITYEDPVESSFVKNVYMYDFGENNAGVCELKISGEKGQCVTLYFGEELIEGKFSVRSTLCMHSGREMHLEYPQMDKYILKGEGEEKYTPPFTYHGFRYVLVEGITEEQAKKDLLTYKVMSSNMEKRADFSCSNEIINKLYEMTLRSDRANILYVPTDCPHREKNGWTADISLSSEHILMNMKAENTFSEWMRNVCKAQRESGELPGIIPTAGWGFEWGNGPAWDSVCVYMPFYTYKYTGNTEIIKESLKTISKYIDYISGKRNEKGLVEIGLEDWAQPLGNNIADKTLAPLIFTDSAMILDIASKTVFLAEVTNDTALGEKAAILAKEMRKAIRENLIDFDTFTAFGNCQTSQAIAIEFGIFEDHELKKAFQKLLEIIKRDNNRILCGVLGARFIFHILSREGYGDLAFDMITASEYPSYANWVENGYTALAETFLAKGQISRAGQSSQNHHFWGDIASFFIREFAGLKVNPNNKDLSEFEISPNFTQRLDNARCEYNSICGKLALSWERKENGIALNTEIPKGIKGKIKLPIEYSFLNGESITDIKEGNLSYEIIKMEGVHVEK